MISIHDPVALDELCRSLRIDTNAVRRLRNVFYKKQQDAAVALLELPAEVRARVAGEVEFHVLSLQSRHDSACDGASKLIFRAGSGKLLETVILRIRSGRTSLCVSSQVGCAVRCAFCATGQMGSVVDLRADEILDQIVQANALLRAEERSIRNIVFMGMGEPLLNEMEVAQAVETILCPGRLQRSPAHVLVSTVGIAPALLRFARRFPRVGLAVSLHSARQDVRERLIPLARRYPLAELRAALVATAAVQSRRIMIEYLLLDGINDSDTDLDALIAYLDGLPVHINLIPYNPINAAPDFTGTPMPRRRQFAARLSAAGFAVTMRYSLGADIAAACGQLVQQQHAMPFVGGLAPDRAATVALRSEDSASRLT